MALKRKKTRKKTVSKKVSKKKVIRKKPAKKAIRKVIKKKTVRTPKKPLKKKKPSAKKTAAKKPAAKKVLKNVIGAITHYFPHVRAAVIKLKAPLSTGEVIKIIGHTTDFTQTVTSMQIDRVPITAAKKGQEIGLRVTSRVRQRDVVCKP